MRAQRGDMVDGVPCTFFASVLATDFGAARGGFDATNGVRCDEDVATLQYYALSVCIPLIHIRTLYAQC